MIKTVLKIEGMACGMCEAHINDTIRKIYPSAKKTSASHKKGEAVFVTENAPDESMLKKAINDTGYTFVSMTSEPYEEKNTFGKGGKTQNETGL